jgi:tRNA pseudouridine synthase 10
MEPIMDKAVKILTKYPLCCTCLGRLFAGLGRGIGNRLRGESIKALLTMMADAAIREGDQSAYELVKILARSGWGPAHQIAAAQGLEYEKRDCVLCLNKLTDENIESIAKKAAETALRYEFKTFLVGAKIPRFIKIIEENIFSEYSLTYAESIRKDIDREVGKRLEEYLGREVDFNYPELLLVVDIFTGHVEARPSPLFIKGQYLKHEAGIPQTPWLCRNCWGAGCPKCDFKGREYDHSISEFIGLPAVKLSGAIDHVFHAAGREDLDALVEYEGRPFIVELREPRRRVIDFEEYLKLVYEYSSGKVEVKDLSYASRSEVRLLKTYLEKAKKKYLAIVTFESPISDSVIKELEAYFTNRVIEQQTPIRVLSRRADKIRRKNVYSLSVNKIDDYTLSFEILADAGLYIKELIHGDSGRTRPSVSDFVCSSPKEIKLTVLEVREDRLQST